MKFVAVGQQRDQFQQKRELWLKVWSSLRPLWSIISYAGSGRGPCSRRIDILVALPRTRCFDQMNSQVERDDSLILCWSQFKINFYIQPKIFLKACFVYIHWSFGWIKPQLVFNESYASVFNVRSFDWHIGGLNVNMPCSQSWSHSSPCSNPKIFYVFENSGNPKVRNHLSTSPDPSSPITFIHFLKNIRYVVASLISEYQCLLSNFRLRYNAWLETPDRFFRVVFFDAFPYFH